MKLLNQAACDLAKEVANKGDALVAGNISQVPSYLTGLGKEAVQKEFKKQTDIFIKHDVDFLIGEVNISYFYFTSLLSIRLYGNSHHCKKDALVGD